MKKKTTDVRRGPRERVVFPRSNIRHTPELIDKNGKQIPSQSAFVKRLDFAAKKTSLPHSKKKRGVMVVMGGVLFFLGFSAVMQATAIRKTLFQVQLETQISVEEGLARIQNQKFAEASFSFSQIRSQINDLSDALSPLFLLNNALGTGAKKSILVAEQVAQLAEEMVPLSSDLVALPSLFLRGEGGSFFALSDTLFRRIHDANATINLAESALSDFEKWTLLPGQKKLLRRAEKVLRETRKNIRFFSNALLAAREFLGERHPHTASFFFQNTGEIRATGGFPGSLALLDSNDGKMTFTFRDIYFFGWKNGSRFPPPLGFQRLTDRLYLRDSNSFFDFPKSAEQMRTMLEYSGGPTSETIFVVSDSFLVALLKEIGPIPIPKTEEKLTAENALFLLSFLVENKSTGKHSPKNVLKNILPEIVKRVHTLSPQTLFRLLREAVEKKWILAHSQNPRIQQFFLSLGVDGSVSQTKSDDYLAVVSANVGGNKSDRFLREELTLSSVLNLDGEAYNTLQIRHYHEWGNIEETQFAELFEKYATDIVGKTLLKNILGAGDNHRFVQIFVPKGSRLLSADGVPIELISVFDESNKTVFAVRFPRVPARQHREITLKYRLPTKKWGDDFSLFFQTQPGARPIVFTRRVLSERGVKIGRGSFAEKIVERDTLFETQL